jgi:2-polyprenyl-3-methyl-5-hydroxy-6-metoxy-1,4-benzoquinol methylase
MPADYRQRIYDSYLRTSGHYYQAMLSPEVYEGLRPFYRANHLPWLPADRTSAVIDIGCGAGHFVYFLRHEGFTKAEGIDASPEMVRQCEATGLPGIVLADWREHLAVRRGMYGAVVANDFLEHLTKDEILEFLDLALAALVPSGRVVLKLPNAYTMFGSRDAYVDFTHQLSFTPQSALQVLAAVGFADICVRPVHAPVRSLKAAVKRIMWEIGFQPVLRAWSVMSDGERKPAVYTVNMIVSGKKPDESGGGW